MKTMLTLAYGREKATMNDCLMIHGTTAAVRLEQPEAGLLARYDAMVTAIAECERVDEAKDIRDKAAALAAYYRQAQNLEAERKAANVRLRAERRTGELLKELAGAPGQRTDLETLSNDATRSPYAEALERTGMSRHTAHRYQRLATVPADVFEAALADPVEKPTTDGILARDAVRLAEIQKSVLAAVAEARKPVDRRQKGEECLQEAKRLDDLYEAVVAA